MMELVRFEDVPIDATFTFVGSNYQTICICTWRKVSDLDVVRVHDPGCRLDDNHLNRVLISRHVTVLIDSFALLLQRLG